MTTQKIKILLIEDDTPFATVLSEFLSRHNMEVSVYDNPFNGLSALTIHPYDVLLLDLSLPGMDGLEVLRTLRKNHDIPVIISSARSDLDDKLMGLELGADDYLPKPYDPKELHARILTVLRRLKPQEENLSCFSLNEEAFEITMHGNALKLTRAEYEIFSQLIKRHACTLSREEIITHAPSLREGNPKSIEVLIGRIRQKIGDNTKEPEHLQAVRGFGYKLIG